ncbi:c-type cytochrome [Sphingobium aquiterrae]|uniref:c-type cytochrome n=1 Tax=Sphingobium aquiterrae TaxID=2038656 RepID=UPI003AFA41F5
MRVLISTLVLLSAAVLGGCSDDDHAARLRAAGPRPTLAALLKVASVDAGAGKFGQCLACHSIGKGALDLAGPNLHGILGKPVGGASPNYGYTYALSAAGGRWDDARMDAWIAAPMRFAPGTKMTFAGVPDPLDRADIIAYLRTQAD